MKICFVSIDIEPDFGGKEKKFQGIANLKRILAIFEKYDIPATLFVTGEVLEKYPNLALEWGKTHEIASHSFSHRFWNALGVEERETELKNFIALYREIFDRNPKGFRAPSHIIDKDGLKLLEEKGFLYDSSVLPHYPPFKKYRGYSKKAPTSPYFIREKLLEIPVTGLKFGIPLSGAWLSKLPFFFYRIMFLISDAVFLTFNLHSWDTLNSGLLKKIDKILAISKEKKYQFLNGEKIYAQYENFGSMFLEEKHRNDNTGRF